MRVIKDFFREGLVEDLSVTIMWVGLEVVVLLFGQMEADEHAVDKATPKYNTCAGVGGSFNA